MRRFVVAARNVMRTADGSAGFVLGAAASILTAGVVRIAFALLN